MPTEYCKRDLHLILNLTIGGSANDSLPVIFMGSVYVQLLNGIPPPPQYWMLRTYDRIKGALRRAPRWFQRILTYCWDPEGRYRHAWVGRRHQHYGHEVTEFRKTLYAYPAIEIISPVQTCHACKLVRWGQQYQQFNLGPICEIF
jgi:hypothetical protein